MITDKASAYYNCLADIDGKPLQFEDKQELCYRALPHYQEMVNQRLEKQMTLPNSQKTKLIKTTNQPIPLQNPDEMGYLYLPEFYKKKKFCHILELDGLAMLNILTKSEFFPPNIRNQAIIVRDIRTEWERGLVEEWDKHRERNAFLEIDKLAESMHNNIERLENIILPLAITYFSSVSCIGCFRWSFGAFPGGFRTKWKII